MTTNTENQTHQPCELDHYCGDGHLDADAGPCHCYVHNVYHCFECLHGNFMRFFEESAWAQEQIGKMQSQAQELKGMLASTGEKLGKLSKGPRIQAEDDGDGGRI